MNTMTDPNVLSLAIAPFVSGAIAFLAVRYGKNHDAGVQAQAAILAIPTKIIDQLNERLVRTTEEIDKLWARDRECRGELDRVQNRMRVLEEAKLGRT